MTPQILTLHETAALLRKSVDRFSREWRTMMAEQDFPPPVNESGRWLWCRLHIEAWLDRKLPEDLREAVAAARGTPQTKDGDAGESAAILEFAARLDREYG